MFHYSVPTGRWPDEGKNIWRYILRKHLFKSNHITQSKIYIGMRYKGDHSSFLLKRINDKIIFTTMMPGAASLFGQKFFKNCLA